MKPSISKFYLDSLFTARDDLGLAHLSALVAGSKGFDLTLDDYGLPPPLFLFVESLSWFAQAVRSGAGTYYEATPVSRQQLMHGALAAEAPGGFAEHYAVGMAQWEDEARMEAIDAWMDAHDAANTAWLWMLCEKHRLVLDAQLGLPA